MSRDVRTASSPHVAAPVVASEAYSLRPMRIVKTVEVPAVNREGRVFTAPITGSRGDTVENANESGGAPVVCTVDGDDIASLKGGLAVVGGGPICAGANSSTIDKQFKTVVASEVHIHMGIASLQPAAAV